MMGLQPCVSWPRALCDNPDAAVLRVVLKCTGMLILHHSILWHEGWLGYPQLPPTSGQIGCSCTSPGPSTVRPKEGQNPEVRHTVHLSSNTSVLDPSAGAWLRAQQEPGASGAPCQQGAPFNKILREVKLASVWLYSHWSLVPPPQYSQLSFWGATGALFSAGVDVEGHPCPTLDTAAESRDQSPNTMGHEKGNTCMGLNCALSATGAAPCPVRRMCPVLPHNMCCVGDCYTTVHLFKSGSDLAERREVQGCQGAVEHVPHCSQQLEAGKHLVKEMREWLLQGEKWKLGAGPAGIAACAPLEDGAITPLAPFPTRQPPKYSAAPKGLQSHKAVGWDT